MEHVDYLIIGGGVAGTTAAETIRQHEKKARVVVVSDEPHRLYSRILLTKPDFFLEKIPFDRIWLKKESWYKENQIELLAGKSAVGLDAVQKTVTLDDRSSISYTKLLLAIGGCKRKLTAQGADKEGVCYLRTVEDAKRIINAVKTAHSAVVVGGGFIGFEASSMLRQAGIEVIFVYRKAHYQEDVLGKEISLKVENAMEQKGVKLAQSNEVVEVLGDDHVEGVILKDGTKHTCDIVIIGIGITCSFAWLEAAGVETNQGIIANEYLETNLPDVWSAGDGTEFDDVILKEREKFGNWVNSQFQGKTAALNMIGKRQRYKKISFLTTHGFGFFLGFVGDVRHLENRQIIMRGNTNNDSCTRLILRENRIVGAVLINESKEMGEITQLIERQVNVLEHIEKLKDKSFDLNTLLQV